MSTLTLEGDWYACHTRPRCEKKFAALMAAESFDHYLPLVASVRRYGKVTKRFTKPLFPGYVFARIPSAGKNRIYQLELLARAIPVDDETRFHRQIEDVRKMISAGVQFTLVPLLTRGRRVRVQGGPLNGLEGLVDDSSNPLGIVISVDVLRQGLLLKVSAESLRAVD
jgi:transcriptional antiterminator RfaH